MSNNSPTIICITGPDGSGKSTLVDALIKEIPEAREVTIWDALDNTEVALFSNKKDVDDYLCILSPDARLLFLGHALQYAIDKALASGVATIIVNAYYYKYFSAEKVLGADQTLMDTLTLHLPVPDITIFLSLSPELSATRKKYLSKYECGCREATSAHFIEFQKKANTVFETYIQSDWHILNAEDTPETLTQKALQIIKS